MYLAVCDDRLSELENLIRLLTLWQEEHHTRLQYKTFRNATELLNAAEKERFTLYLLDVMMPGTDGMAAAREIRSFDEAADIVFLTSSPDFAYASYGVHALESPQAPPRGQALCPSRPPHPTGTGAAGRPAVEKRRHPNPYPLFSAHPRGGHE